MKGVNANAVNQRMKSVERGHSMPKQCLRDAPASRNVIQYVRVHERKAVIEGRPGHEQRSQKDGDEVKEGPPLHGIKRLAHLGSESAEWPGAVGPFMRVAKLRGD